MEHVLLLLIRYRYFILFPLAIVEGPVVTIIAGFLCSIGVFNPFLVYAIIIVADNIGDTLYYALGYWGRSGHLEKLSTWLGLTQQRLDRVKKYIGSNPYKTITLSKIILGVGVAGLFLAGKSKVPYLRFFKICLLTSIVQCAVYLGIGYFFGAFYQQISHYLDYVASISIVAAIGLILFFIIRSKLKKI